MTKLTFERTIFPAQDMNGESSLPALSEIMPFSGYSKTDLDEDDDFWAGFGTVPSPFPYRMQDKYTRALHDTEFITPVLENDYLKAVFMPAYGGKLWSLYDKVNKKDLLLSNPVVRPCNLAIRNAWTSGGVEWNCGFLGHHPYTCDMLYTAETKLDDGTPVLRMYQYERVRQVVYQMDFFLPEDSHMLYARMRIVNDKPYPVPIYWWSNIAVPEVKGSRVIAPVNECYTFFDDGYIRKTPVPHPAKWNCDITYPTNLTHAVDFFWKIPTEERKFISCIDKDGYGLIQCSTARLKGRKLFVWGQGPGGKRWQNYLSSDDYKGAYAEIQCGLAQSQYESIPMPPRSAWEWLEGYGAMQTDVEKAHGEWQGAKAEIKAKLDDIVSVEYMEQLLKDTKKMALSPAETKIYGKSWAALENARRAKEGEKPLCPHLDFGEIDSDMADWVSLLEKGEYPEHCANGEINSWMLSEEWEGAMKAAADKGDWYSLMQYGMTCLAKQDFEKAKLYLEKSLSRQASYIAYYGMAQLYRIAGDKEAQKSCILSAYALKKGDISLIKEVMSELFKLGEYAKIIDIYNELEEEFANVPRIKLYAAYSYFKVGDVDKAESMLCANGGLLVPDVREGEESVTNLYVDIAIYRAKLNGIELTRETAKIPAEFDFRMQAE